MLQEFNSHLENLLGKESKRLLLAVSGGIDSMVLCCLMLRTEHNFEIAHCNFGLREEESDADKKFVIQWGKKNQINAHCIQFDTKTYAEKNKVSIQMAARELRYSWFDELKENFSFDYIITAHHCDDQVETFLINFLRGTGLKGLKGIPEKNEKYLRPLLPFSREQIEAFAKKENISWREDSSNKSRKYLRNKLRHEVIPLLKEENPQLQESFLQTIEHLQQTQSLVDAYMLQLKKEIIEEKQGYISFKIAPLLQHKNPKAVLYELLTDYGFREWNNVKDLLTAEKGKQVVSERFILEKDKDSLCLFTKNTSSDNAVFEVKNSKEVVTFGSQILNFNQVEKTEDFSSKEVIVDAEKVVFPLQLRKVKSTDKFKPLGMNQHKKVLKFLKDEGVPTSFKKETYVLTSNEKIVCVVNHRIDNDFRVTTNTKKCLIIHTDFLPIS